jgi:hypothetical protein
MFDPVGRLPEETTPSGFTSSVESSSYDASFEIAFRERRWTNGAQAKQFVARNVSLRSGESFIVAKIVSLLDRRRCCAKGSPRELVSDDS